MQQSYKVFDIDKLDHRYVEIVLIQNHKNLLVTSKYTLGQRTNMYLSCSYVEEKRLRNNNISIIDVILEFSDNADIETGNANTVSIMSLG